MATDIDTVTFDIEAMRLSGLTREGLANLRASMGDENPATVAVMLAEAIRAKCEHELIELKTRGAESGEIMRADVKLGDAEALLKQAKAGQPRRRRKKVRAPTKPANVSATAVARFAESVTSGVGDLAADAAREAVSEVIRTAESLVPPIDLSPIQEPLTKLANGEAEKLLTQALADHANATADAMNQHTAATVAAIREQTGAVLQAVEALRDLQKSMVKREIRFKDFDRDGNPLAAEIGPR